MISSAYHTTGTPATGQGAPGKRPAQSPVSAQRDGVTRRPGRRDTVRRITTVLLIPLAFCVLIMAASAVDVNNSSMSATTAGTNLTQTMTTTSSSGSSGSYTGVSQVATSTTTATTGSSTGSGLSVTKTTLDPEVLMPGDSGTLTIVVSNSGSTAVDYTRATLAGSSVTTTDSTQYASGGSISPGSTMQFIFPIQAGTKVGVQYPEFVLNLDSNTLRYPVAVKVSDTNLAVSVASQPDAYVQGFKDSIVLSIGNPRQNSVNGIQIIPSGDGSTISPGSIFIGALASNSEISKTFSVTPSREGNVTFQVSYQNGLNVHTAYLTIPITFSEDKTRADLLISDTVITQSAGVTHITGNVNNAGLKDANGVVVTTGGTGTPVDPYKQAVIGSLAANDFSSFEVTFTDRTNSASVPLVISYKDANGNSLTRTVTVDIKSSTSNMTAGNGGAPSGSPPSGAMSPPGQRNGIVGTLTGLALPIVAVLVVIGGAALYIRRRKR